MNKRHIYIIQMHSKTLPSKIVKLVTRYKYSHIGVCLDKNCEVIYSFGRRSLYNIFYGGFVVEHKDGSFFRRFNRTECRVYELEVSENQYLQIEKQLRYMEKNKDIYKYDFLGAFLRMFNIPVTFKNRYVCSQFVAELLGNVNVCTFQKNLCFIKPQDFEIIEGVREIYCGEYLLYDIKQY